MKTRSFGNSKGRCSAGALTALLLVLLVSTAWGQGTLIRYQGRLADGGSPANGTYDLRFILYSADIGGNQVGPILTNLALTVTDGLFSTALDFGAGVFPGDTRWLELAARTNGVGDFTTLSPRQALLPVPYAIHAATATTATTALTATSATQAAAVPWGGITGLPAGLADGVDNDTMYSAGTGLSLNGTAFSVNFAGTGAAENAARSDHGHAGVYAPAAHPHSGADITSGTVAEARIDAAVARDSEILPTVLANDGPGSGLDADRLDGFSSAEFWKSGGNTGTTGGTHFLGTTDNQPLELKVHGVRGLRLEPNGTNAPNLIGGHPSNSIAPGTVGATIAGGGAMTDVGLSLANSIAASYSTIGGGWQNSVAANSVRSFIGAGQFNRMNSGATDATIGGGNLNEITATEAVIGGGYANKIQAGAVNAAIGGGYLNQVGASAGYSTIGGGSGNEVSNTVWYATVPGGRDNLAAGWYSLAAGRRAKANHHGSFVWGDSTGADVASTTNDQFVVRASNGVRLTQNAGSGKTINVGDRYRDNALIAWAKVSSGGTLQAEFGVASVTNSATGIYDVVLNASAADAFNLVPLAVAEVDAPPFSAAAARLVTINQVAADTFTVYIANGNHAAANNDFVFMVTGR